MTTTKFMTAFEESELFRSPLVKAVSADSMSASDQVFYFGVVPRSPLKGVVLFVDESVEDHLEFFQQELMMLSQSLQVRAYVLRVGSSVSMGNALRSKLGLRKEVQIDRWPNHIEFEVAGHEGLTRLAAFGELSLVVGDNELHRLLNWAYSVVLVTPLLVSELRDHLPDWVNVAPKALIGVDLEMLALDARVLPIAPLRVFPPDNHRPAAIAATWATS